MADVRGDPWEHDPGPTTASGWADVFAATPNYRGLGKEVVGREAFRWHHGPMFYRGRLDGSARVMVVGRRAPRTSRSRIAPSPAGRVPGCSICCGSWGSIARTCS